ncbi:hypothetical protein HY994_05705 [Candidatus Micrarchaeota archaeon]|nr:hypothetical protein [Candidatus Micrarchaeota archaeon]
MTSMTINMTIRDLDEDAYRKLKTRAVEENKNLGKAASEAFVMWAAQPKKKTGKAFLEVLENPPDWGFRTNLSKEVDEYVYR